MTENVSRYGRVRKPSDIAKAVAVAFYYEEMMVPNWQVYVPLANFMWNNFDMRSDAIEDDYSGHWHTMWTFQGLDRTL